MSSTLEIIEYYELMQKKFPNTIFRFAYDKGNTFSNDYLLKDIEILKIKNSFSNRKPLINNNSFEVIFDLDQKTFKENLEVLAKLKQSLINKKIKKFVCYYSGGKGIHIHMRFKFLDEIKTNFDIRTFSNDLRKFFLKNVNAIVDNLPANIISCEGTKHRTFYKPKLIIDVETMQVTPLSVDINYLSDKFVNNISNQIIKRLGLKDTETLTEVKKSPNLELNKPPSLDNLKIQWHIKRFIELYKELKDGRKRFLVCVKRYIYLTYKELNKSCELYQVFLQEININKSLDDIKKEFGYLIPHIKTNCIFMFTKQEYSFYLTKEMFYKNYPYT